MTWARSTSLPKPGAWRAGAVVSAMTAARSCSLNAPDSSWKGAQKSPGVAPQGVTAVREQPTAPVAAISSSETGHEIRMGATCVSISSTTCRKAEHCMVDEPLQRIVRRHMRESGHEWRSLQRFMEVVAETVRRHDKEHLEPASVALVDAPVADVDVLLLQLGLHCGDS